MKVFKLKEKDNIIARNQTISIGLDVHGKNTEVVVLGPDEVLHRQSFPTKREHFIALGRRFEDCRVRAVYEASSIGYKPLRWLREAGFDAYMTSPAMIPSRKGEYIKTDRRDALKLAQYNRGDLLDPVWDLTDQQYDDRELVRSRKQLVENRSRCCQQIKSKLKHHGVRPPEGMSTRWTKAYLEWLSSEPSDQPGLDASVAAMVETYRAFTDQISVLTNKIKALARTDRYRKKVALLVSAPGVGPLTAMTFLVELGDIEQRFDTCEDLSSFLGLAPGENSSGSNQRKESTPQGGNKWVRTALVQCSWRLIGQDEELRAVYDRIKARNPNYGPAIAIVAVARRLALALRAMLRDGVGWRGEVIEFEDRDDSTDADATTNISN